MEEINITDIFSLGEADNSRPESNEFIEIKFEDMKLPKVIAYVYTTSVFVTKLREGEVKQTHKGLLSVAGDNWFLMMKTC